MRTPITNVVLIASLLSAPLALAETQSEGKPAKPAIQNTATRAPAPAANPGDVTTQQVALQVETPRDNALRNIKVYPCF